MTIDESVLMKWIEEFKALNIQHCDDDTEYETTEEEEEEVEDMEDDWRIEANHIYRSNCI